MSELLCGIDLGTTNSCIAYLRDGKPVAIPIGDGSPIVPSVISLDEKTGRILVGREARNRLAAYPEHTVRSIKRLMGKDTKVMLGGKTLTPEEASSHILKYLAERASDELGRQVRKAVITVPAYFNDAQRRATIAAGELAGLEVSRIINEPTAASLVYDYAVFSEKSDSPYILVYDLGGGTFDVSVLEVKDEIKEVLASCGDTALGGDDFDERLVSHFIRHLREKTGQDLAVIPAAMHMRLKDIAERTKILLSDTPYAHVSEAAVGIAGGITMNLDIEVSRREYEDMTGDLIQKTAQKVEEALREARLDASEIGEVILVGGVTRMPAVQEILANLFDRPMAHSIDPDLCVGLGAAVQSGLIAGEPLGHILLDVTAHSLGVKTIDEVNDETGEADFFSVIIRRNTKVPVRKAEEYFTLTDKQEMVQVEVFQGESRSCAENSRVGEFMFHLKPAPVTSPIICEFIYDKEGIIHISLDQKGFKNTKEVTLDVRNKKVTSREEGEADGQVVNYIIAKYKKLLSDKKLPPDLHDELALRGNEYEKALVAGTDEARIDETEDRLLEIMEEAEERMEGLE